MKTIRLILTFYKTFAFTSYLITLICLGTLFTYKEQGIHLIQALFWFKVVTLAVIYYSVNNHQRHQFYYFRNLGISKQKLWISVLSFDLIFFGTTVITLALKLYETTK